MFLKLMKISSVFLILSLVFSYLPMNSLGIKPLVPVESPAVMDSKILNQSNIVNLNTNGSFYLYTGIDAGGVSLKPVNFNSMANVTNLNKYTSIISGFSKESYGKMNTGGAAYYAIGGIAIGNNSGIDHTYSFYSKYFFMNDTTIGGNWLVTGGNFNVTSSGSLVVVVMASSNSLNMTYNSSFKINKLNYLNTNRFILYQGYSVLNSGTYSITASFNENELYSYASADAFVGIYIFNGATFTKAYPVTFTEKGLPSGSPWYVNLSNGQGYYSNSNKIYFYETNGTYEYYPSNSTNVLPSPSKGTLQVSGNSLNLTVNYYGSYSVNFFQNGLPYMTGTWFVNLTTGQSRSSSYQVNETSFDLINGTYNFTVASSNKGWEPNISYGSFRVSGKEINISITFKPVTYNITFSETGLPSGTKWFVNISFCHYLNAFTNSSKSSIIKFKLQNNSDFSNCNLNIYLFEISSVNKNYLPIPSSGSFNVSGSNMNFSVKFVKLYRVTFKENGLPSGFKWYVNVSGNVNESSTGNTIIFSLTNGSYNYSVGSLNSSYRPLNSSSKFTLNGNNITLNVSFAPVLYRVYFYETGLPAGAAWFLNLSNGDKFSSKSTNLTFLEMNGTYHYTVSSNLNYSTEPSYGIFIVKGNHVYVNLTFKRSYQVMFVEENLISGVLWGINLNSSQGMLRYTNKSISTGGSIIVDLWNGTYHFSVIGTPIWYNDTGGSFIISGSEEKITIIFSWNSSAAEHESNNIAFPPGGMLYIYAASTGGAWPAQSVSYTPALIVGNSIVVIGQSKNNTGSFITYATYYSFAGIRIPFSGNYSAYNIYSFSSVFKTNVSGKFSLPYDAFVVLVSSTSAVTYLPNETISSSLPFKIDSKTAVGNYTTGAIIASAWAKPGNYSVTVGYSGYANVNAMGLCIYVFYMGYNVSFRENGLPSGSKWYVNMSNGKSYSGSGQIISFMLPNGTYSYTVSTSDKNYVPTTQSGKFSVNGKPDIINITFNAVEFKVSFIEKGLPNGTEWYVGISNQTYTSSYNSISFSEMNGTYTYNVNSASKEYKPVISSGSFTINGKNIVINVTFVTVTYKITFSETGLPNGTVWYVNMSNGKSYSSNTSTIIFVLMNGSYSYIIGDSNKNYKPLISSGKFYVNGSDQFFNVTFTSGYSVEFIETGLPNGTVWYVNMSNGKSYSSNTSTIIFVLMNGSYSYVIEDSNKNYSPYPEKGNFTVINSSIEILIRFNLVKFSVIYIETGLANGTEWYVKLGNETEFSYSNRLVFSFPNGTYNYVIGTVPGYNSSLKTGIIKINGSNITVNVTFYQIKYMIIFSESGLEPQTQWYVTVGNITHSSTNSTIIFYEPDGSHVYEILPIPGYRTDVYSGTIVVNGTSLNISVKWTLMKYSIMIKETGLPNGTEWYVILKGKTFYGENLNVTLNITGNIIQISEPNGSYIFYSEKYLQGKTGVRYISTVYEEIVYVNGSDVSINISYEIQYYLSMISYPSNGGILLPLSGWYNSTTTIKIEEIPNKTFEFVSWSGTGNGSYTGSKNNVTIKINGPITEKAIFIKTYGIKFFENGLPDGTGWFINISDKSYISYGNFILVNVTNGSYGYMAGTLNKRYSSYGGSFTVNGSGKIINITFKPVQFSVTFTENGLPWNTTWTIIINNTSESGMGNITVFEMNGTYSFEIQPVRGFNSSIYTGTLYVNGKNITVNVTFYQIKYMIIFRETGLNSGSNWSVSLDNITESTMNESIIFMEPNGTYHYSVFSLSGYRINNASGTVIVNGNSIIKTVTFNIILYPIKLVEKGISNGTQWSATLTGKTFTGKYVNLTLSSTNDTIIFMEPNGSYFYVIHLPSGYQVTTRMGKINISGNMTIETIPVSQNFSYLPVIIALIIIISVIVVAFSILSFKKRKK